MPVFSFRIKPISIKFLTRIRVTDINLQSALFKLSLQSQIKNYKVRPSLLFLRFQSAAFYASSSKLICLTSQRNSSSYKEYSNINASHCMFAQLVMFPPDEEVVNSENSCRSLEFDSTANLCIIMRIEKNYSPTLTSFKLVELVVQNRSTIPYSKWLSKKLLQILRFICTI